MHANIYDNYRNASEKYRIADIRHISYSDNMSDREKRLQHIREMAELGNTSISGLCIKAGLNKSTFNKYFEEDNTSMPSINSMDKAAQFLGYDDYNDFVIKRALPGHREVVDVRVVATAPGGAWSEAYDHVIKTVQYMPRKTGKFVGVIIKGQSVNRLIRDGETAIVDISRNDPSKLADKLVIVQCGGEVTCKIYRKDPERFEPFSDDPGFQTIYPKDECNIIGMVVDKIPLWPDDFR